MYWDSPFNPVRSSRAEQYFLSTAYLLANARRSSALRSLDGTRGHAEPQL
jgi:hypothetical protein